MRLPLCIVFICLLSACSRSPQDEDPRTYPGETPAAEMTEDEARSAERALEEAMKAVPSPAASAEVPSLATGLWQVTYRRDEMGFNETRQICVDHALASTLAEAPANPEPMQCSERQLRLAGDEVQLDTVCTRNDTKVTRHIVITAADDKRFSHSMQTVYEPASAGHGIVNTTAEGKRIGDCSAGMKPGTVKVVANS